MARWRGDTTFWETASGMPTVSLPSETSVVDGVTVVEEDAECGENSLGVVPTTTSRS